MMFGKKPLQKPEKAGAASPQTTRAGDGNGGLPPPASNFPWAGQKDEIGCNFAFAHLVRNLPVRLTSDGRIHAETLMAAAGVVAGIAAQISLISDPAVLTKAKATGQLVDATFKDGRVMLYGDALNLMLYTNDVALARARVWNMLVAAALSTGMNRQAIPNMEALFQHVTRAMGSEREGFPSTPPNHQPLLSAHDLLKLVAPLAFECLTGEIDAITKKNGFRAFETSWVTVTAQAAANVLIDATQVLAPELCVTIGMESAIYASKIRGNLPSA